MHNTLSLNSTREVTYYDPIRTAELFILAEQPVPVDLIEELESQGIIFEEFKDSLLSEVNMTTDDSIGFHLVG